MLSEHDSKPSKLYLADINCENIGKTLTLVIFLVLSLTPALMLSYCLFLFRCLLLNRNLSLNRCIKIGAWSNFEVLSRTCNIPEMKESILEISISTFNIVFVFVITPHVCVHFLCLRVAERSLFFLLLPVIRLPSIFFLILYGRMTTYLEGTSWRHIVVLPRCWLAADSCLSFLVYTIPLKKPLPFDIFLFLPTPLTRLVVHNYYYSC